jgi:hypothetical protein
MSHASAVPTRAIVHRRTMRNGREEVMTEEKTDQNPSLGFGNHALRLKETGEKGERNVYTH